MFRPLELFIGLRYTRAKRRNHFISFISLTSMLGIALGVTALITVLSVMNGFQREVRNGILGMAAHSTITGLDGSLADWRGLAGKLAQQPHVLGLAPYIEGQAMLTNGQIVSGVLIRGVLPEEEPKVSYVDKKMLSGALSDLKPGEFGIILGRGLAQNLGVGRGDKVTLVTPQANVTPAGILPRLKRFTVVGIFQVGNNEYDGSLALLHLEDAAKLMQMPDRVSGLRLKLDDIFAAPAIAQELAQRLTGEYLVSDWTRQHAIYFRAVDIEKKMMFVILTLIVAVAAFNIVSTMVMVVTDKQADIAILRTLGTTPMSVMAIFMVQGMVIGVIGTLLGMIGGVSLALNVPDIVPFFERLFSFQLFPQNVYLINKLPSEMRWGDVFQITSLAFLLSFSATLYPAWRAARTQPAEALRYE